MFKLLRRISSSIYPRSDRPWSDDATSNAPTIGRKRRLSDEDGDGDDVRDTGSSRKRRVPLEREGTSEVGELRVKGTEVDPCVKEVTRGVKEVELEDKKEGSATVDEDGKGATEEASTTLEGEPEPSVALPHDPASTPLSQEEGDNQSSTVPNDDEEAHSETIAEAEASSDDSPEKPLAQVEDEKDSPDATPAIVNDEVSCTAELVYPSPETTSSAEANDGPLQEQPEQ